MNETIRTLTNRRSVRKYKKAQICDEDLHLILQAGMNAASAKGIQPCTIVVVQNPDTLGRLTAMNAAAALHLGSCWINRAREEFELPEGKSLLREWGLPEHLVGVGHCIVGYGDGPEPAASPRKDNFIKFIR